jgi:hypothetical protein
MGLYSGKHIAYEAGNRKDSKGDEREMKLEECSVLKIGDKIMIKGLSDSECPAQITHFDYKAAIVKDLWSPEREPKKVMYYDIIRIMTDTDLKELEAENERAKKPIKMPRCPDCKKPIDKCKCIDEY